MDECRDEVECESVGTFKNRMKATAPLRKTNKHSINHLKQFQEGEDQSSNHRYVGFVKRYPIGWINVRSLISSLNHA
jgi:hypothetical protein